MHKTKTLFVNSASNIGSKILSALIQIICLPVLIAIYGKGEYGLLGIAMSLNTFFAILQLGLPAGIPKFVAEWHATGDYQTLHKATRTAFSLYLAAAAVNLLLILAIRYAGIDYFRIYPEQSDTLKSLLIVTAAASFISIPVNFIEQLLTGVQEIAFVSTMQMVKNAVFAGLVLFVYLNPQQLSVVDFYIAKCVIMFCTVPVELHRWQKYGSLKTFIPGRDFRAIMPLLKYCISLMAIGIFIMLAGKLRPVIMSLRVSEDAAGHMTDFQIINYIGTFLLMVSSCFVTALVPYISHEYATGNLSVYQKVIQEATKPVWAFGALLGFGVILLSKELLTIYVGPDNTYLQKWLILLVAGVLYNLYNPCIASVILGSGRTLPLAVITASGCLISLVICWWVSPVSALGSITYSLLAYNSVIGLGVHFYYLKAYFLVDPVRQIVHILFPPVLAGLAMLFGVRYLLDRWGLANPYLAILMGATIGTVVYTALILAIYIRPAEVVLLYKKIRNH